MAITGKKLLVFTICILFFNAYLYAQEANIDATEEPQPKIEAPIHAPGKEPIIEQREEFVSIKDTEQDKAIPRQKQQEIQDTREQETKDAVVERALKETERQKKIEGSRRIIELSNQQKIEEKQRRLAEIKRQKLLRAKEREKKKELLRQKKVLALEEKLQKRDKRLKEIRCNRLRRKIQKYKLHQDKVRRRLEKIKNSNKRKKLQKIVDDIQVTINELDKESGSIPCGELNK